MQIKTLREEVVKQIVAPRQSHAPYRSLHDFLDRMTPDASQAKFLIKAGFWIRSQAT